MWHKDHSIEDCTVTCFLILVQKQSEHAQARLKIQEVEWLVKDVNFAGVPLSWHSKAGMDKFVWILASKEDSH